VIAIYTWVGLLLTNQTGIAVAKPPVVNMGGAAVNLLAPLGPIPLWFLIFSLYTVPLSLVFRRLLKHYSLRRYAATNRLTGVTPGTPSSPSDAGG
jgi:hypothetical protein